MLPCTNHIRKYPRKAYRPSARTKTPGSPICHYRYSQSRPSVPGVPESISTWYTKTPSNPNLRARCFGKRERPNKARNQACQIHWNNVANRWWKIKPQNKTSSKDTQNCVRTPMRNGFHWFLAHTSTFEEWIRHFFDQRCSITMSWKIKISVFHA